MGYGSKVTEVAASAEGTVNDGGAMTSEPPRENWIQAQRSTSSREVLVNEARSVSLNFPHAHCSKLEDA